mmetsp:Transcript_12658/g.20276  ORF Transcript_12658/g.20276 Transcript_12658/m.20276 type:complete len:152 (-) Transcript_12658:264-719(-)
MYFPMASKSQRSITSYARLRRSAPNTRNSQEKQQHREMHFRTNTEAEKSSHRITDRSRYVAAVAVVVPNNLHAERRRHIDEEPHAPYHVQEPQRRCQPSHSSECPVRLHHVLNLLLWSDHEAGACQKKQIRHGIGEGELLRHPDQDHREVH